LRKLSQQDKRMSFVIPTVKWEDALRRKKKAKRVKEEDKAKK